MYFLSIHSLPPSLVAVSLSFFPRLATANHPFRSSARILDGPLARLFCRHFNAHSTSPSVGTPSSTTNDSMVTGMVSPGGGTRLYSLARSAVTRLSVARAGGGARLSCVLYSFIENYACIEYIGCQSKKLRVICSDKIFEDRSYNELLFIGIPEVSMNLISFRGFMKDKGSTVMLL